MRDHGKAPTLSGAKLTLLCRSADSSPLILASHAGPQTLSIPPRPKWPPFLAAALDSNRPGFHPNWDFPGMRKMVEEVVRNCDICNRSRTSRHKPYGLLQPFCRTTMELGDDGLHHQAATF
jgi:hypothetical protein